MMIKKLLLSFLLLNVFGLHAAGSGARTIQRYELADEGTIDIDISFNPAPVRYWENIRQQKLEAAKKSMCMPRGDYGRPIFTKRFKHLRKAAFSSMDRAIVGEIDRGTKREFQTQYVINNHVDAFLMSSTKRLYDKECIFRETLKEINFDKWEHGRKAFKVLFFDHFTFSDILRGNVIELFFKKVEAILPLFEKMNARGKENYKWYIQGYENAMDTFTDFYHEQPWGEYQDEKFDRYLSVMNRLRALQGKEPEEEVLS